MVAAESAISSSGRRPRRRMNHAPPPSAVSRHSAATTSMRSSRSRDSSRPDVRTAVITVAPVSSSGTGVDTTVPSGPRNWLVGPSAALRTSTRQVPEPSVEPTVRYCWVPDGTDRSSGRSGRLSVDTGRAQASSEPSAARSSE